MALNLGSASPLKPKANVHIPGEKLPSCQHSERDVNLETVRYHYEPPNSAELTSANIHQAEIFSKPFNTHLNSWGTSNKTAIFVTRKVLCDICIIYQWSQNLYCSNISLTHWSKGWLNRVRKAGRWMVKTWHLLRGKRIQTFTDCLALHTGLGFTC